MIARAAGAFVITFVLLGYVLSPFEAGEFGIVLLVALGVGGVTALWLRDRPGDRDADFGERAARRAVRRGILRTALVAIVWAAAAYLLAFLASSAWQQRGDRVNHFRLVAEHGFAAAHPGYRTTELIRCCRTGLRDSELRLRAEPRTSTGVVQFIDLDLQLDLRGRVDPLSLDVPRTAVDDALERPPLRAEPLRALVRDVPVATAVTAVVELERPLNANRALALLDAAELSRRDRDRVGILLESRNRRFTISGRLRDNRVGWPTPYVAQFQSWVKKLRGGDDAVLDSLGLPPRARLRALATMPRIHGFVLDDVRLGQLLAIARDNAVRSVAIADAGLDVREPSG